MEEQFQPYPVLKYFYFSKIIGKLGVSACRTFHSVTLNYEKKWIQTCAFDCKTSFQNMLQQIDIQFTNPTSDSKISKTKIKR